MAKCIACNGTGKYRFIPPTGTMYDAIEMRYWVKPCPYCQPHEFYPRKDFKDLCSQCGKKFKDDIHC